MLGSQANHISIFDRGGMRRIGDLENVIRLQYDRVRDDVSSALTTVQFQGMSTSDAAMLEGLHPGRHEMVIHRGDERVWEGPVTRLSFTRHQCTIEARDVMHYAYRTILRAAYNNAYPATEYTTKRAEKMLRAELARKEALNPPINVVPHLDIRTVLNETSRTSRNTPAFAKTLFEDIDDMAAQSGMDYVVIGRSIILFDTHIPLGRTEQMGWDDLLGELAIGHYGMELATYSAVTDGQGTAGAVGGADPYYGLVEVLATVYEEETTQSTAGTEPYAPPTRAELVSQARRNMDGRYPTPLIVRVPDGSQVNPDCSVNYSELVPGVMVPLSIDLPFRRITQLQKLDKVRVAQTPERGEQVSVTLSPWPGPENNNETQVSE